MREFTPSVTEPDLIARHPLFTAREKTELLLRLRAEVTGALENDLDVGVSPSDVDHALEELQRDVARGCASELQRRKDH